MKNKKNAEIKKEITIKEKEKNPAYTEEEEEEVRKRLKDLGYV